MEHITYSPVVSKERERLKFVKYALFFFNVLFFMCGCVLIGIGIWMAVDRNFLTVIIGNDLYAASIYVMLSCGALVFFFSFLGCCAVVAENICLLSIHLVAICILAVSLFAGAVCAIVFQTQMGDQVRQTMSDTLVNYYGVNLEYYNNRMITDGWDKAQERSQCFMLRSDCSWCCLSMADQLTINVHVFVLVSCSCIVVVSLHKEEYQPFVPPSCCVKDRFWRYINLEACQKWRLGPPGSPVDGAVNHALYYEGCFEAGYAYLAENSALVVGLSIAVGLLLVVGIFLTALMIHMIRKVNSLKVAPSNS